MDVAHHIPILESDSAEAVTPSVSPGASFYVVSESPRKYQWQRKL